MTQDNIRAQSILDSPWIYTPRESEIVDAVFSVGEAPSRGLWKAASYVISTRLSFFFDHTGYFGCFLVQSCARQKFSARTRATTATNATRPRSDLWAHRLMQIAMRPRAGNIASTSASFFALPTEAPHDAALQPEVVLRSTTEVRVKVFNLNRSQ